LTEIFGPTLYVMFMLRQRTGEENMSKADMEDLYAREGIQLMFGPDGQMNIGMSPILLSALAA